MPELPEVEITARLLGSALKNEEVVASRAAAVSTLKSFSPPLSDLVSKRLTAIHRRGKQFVLEFGDLSVLLHLMSSGRLQLFDSKASLRDKVVRWTADFESGRQLRLREFGTRQSAWVKVLKTQDVDTEESIATLGPESWPDPPDLKPLLTEPRPLHSILRDQRVIAGIGRSWVDEILHEAKLSPFKRATDLNDAELEELRSAIASIMQKALDHYEDVLMLPIPDKLPMPLRVHRKAGQPCPRCGTELAPVHFENHVIVYCPNCQTQGKLLKDRRLSKLLK